MTSPAFNNSQLGNTIRTDKPTLFVGSSGIVFTDGTQQLTAFTGTAIANESDPIFTSSVAYNITSDNTGEWTEAYNWVVVNSGNVLSSGDNISLLVNDAGYITSYIETDPIFTGSVAYNITSTDTGNWNNAYSWGDHSLQNYATVSGLTATSGYLQSQIDSVVVSETDPIFTGSTAYNITSSDTGNWTSAYNWGDHSAVGYLSSGNNISLLNNDAGYLISADVSGITGNGTTNYISKWSSSNGLTDSVIYDNGTNVGVGTSSPAYKLDVSGTGSFDVLNVNDQFTFPTGDGSGQQTLVTNGSGVVVWKDYIPAKRYSTISTSNTFNSFNTAVNYTVGHIDVFQNGVKLSADDDFTATDGSSVSLANYAPVAHI